MLERTLTDYGGRLLGVVYLVELAHDLMSHAWPLQTTLPTSISDFSRCSSPLLLFFEIFFLLKIYEEGKRIGSLNFIAPFVTSIIPRYEKCDR